MSDQEKYNEQIIIELQELRKELEFLKISSDNELYIQKQTELELRKSEERLKYALEGATDGLWDWDILSNRVFYSTQWKAMLGFTDSEIGDSLEEWSSRIHPNDLEMVMKTVDQHIKGETDSYAFDHRLICKDGSYKWIFDQGKVVSRDEFGKSLRVIGTHKDITQRKKTEFDLNERLKELNCHNQISLVMSDFNLSTDELLQKIVQLIPPAFQFPEHTEVSVQVNNKTYTTPGFIITDHKLSQEIKYQGNNLGQIDVFYSGEPLSFNQPIFLSEESDLLFSLALKIGSFIEKKQKEQEQKVSETKYRSLIERINGVIYEIDKEGIIKYISPSIERIIGYSQNEITGKSFINFVGINAAFLTQRLAELGKNHEISNEYKLQTKAGKDCWIRLSTKAILENGEFVGGTGILIDITEKKLVELELQKSESLYRSILNASPDTIFIADLSGNVLFTSPMALKMFGYENTGFPLHSPLFDFVDPKHHDKAREAIRQMFDGIFSGATEYVGIKSDGSTFDMEVNGEFIRDEEDKPTSMVFIVRDISDRKIAEEKLRNSEEQYRKLVESINDVIYEVDTVGKIKFASPSVIKVLGFTAEEVVGHNIFEFVYPEDIPGIMETLKSLLERDYNYLEYRYMRKDGSIHWVRSSTSAIIENGVMVGGTGILTDITERKLAEEALRVSEEKYRNIFLNAQEGIFQTNIDGTYLSINPALAKMYGYDSPEELMKSRTNISTDSYFNNSERKNFLRMMEIHDFVKGYEYEVKHKDGHKIWFYEDAKAVKDSNGKIQYFEGFVIDITERKLAEETLKDKTDLLTNLIINLQEGILLEDSNRKIVLTNQLFCNMFGIPAPPEALIGADCSTSAEDSKMFFKDPEKFIADIERILENKKAVFNDDLELLDGRFLERDYIPTYIESKYNGHLWKYRDITERRQAQNALADSQEKFSKAFQTAPYAIFITSAEDGKFFEINDSFITHTGYTPEEVLSDSSIGLRIWVNIEDRNQVIADLMDGKEVLAREYNFMKKDGAIANCIFSASIIHLNSKPYILSSIIDISDIKRANEQLRKLSRAVEQSPVSIVITNLEGNIEYANPKACETTGYASEELIGKNPRLLKSGETQTAEYEVLWGNISTGNEWRGVFHNKRKNGELYWESSTISPITDADGMITHYLAVKEDITNRRKTEEALFKSEERFRQIAEQSHTVIWEVDPTGLYTYVSPIAESVWGYTPEALIGKMHFYDLHPEGNRNEFRKKAFESFAKKESFHNLINQVDTRNKGVIVVSTNGTAVLDGQNNLIGYRGADNDITEQKIAEDLLVRSEEALNSAQEIAKMGSWELNVITKKLSWSKNYFRLLNLEPDEKEISNDAFINLVHPEDKYLLNEKLKEIYETRQATSVDMRIITSDGQTKWVQNNIAPIFEGERLISLKGINIDITEKKLAEEALRINEAALNQAQEISKMCSWELDLITEKITWSRNYYQLMGIPNGAEMKTEFFRERVHPEDQHLVTENEEKMRVFKNPVTYDLRLRMPDNEYRWIQNNIVPEFEDEKLVRFKGVNIDVTEKKLAEDSIKQQNERLSAIIDAIPDLILIVDKNGTCLEYYSSTPDMSAIPNEQNVGINIKDIFNEEIAQLYIKKAADCLFQQRLITYNFSGNRNNSIQSFEVRLAPMGTDRVLTFVRDTTDERLKDSEIRKLSLAVEQSPVIIVITDLIGNIEYVNSAFQAITGYRSDEVIGKNTNILKSGSTNPNVYKNMWETIIKGDDWYGEWENKKKNGELYWENVSITPIRDDGGKVTNYLAVKQDITLRKQTEEEISNLNANLEISIVERTSELTLANYYLKDEIEERKRIEEALSESEKSYRTVVDNVNEIIFQTDTEGLWLFLNKSWEVVTGFSVEESLGQLFVNYIHPDDRAQNWELFEPLINREKEYCRYQIRYITKDGGFRWVEVFARLGLNDNNEITGTYGTLQDITVRRQAEAALRDSEIKHTSMITNISDVIGIIGIDGIMSYKSPNITRYFGWQPEDLVGSSGWSTVHPDDLERIQKEFYEVVQKDNAATTVEYLYLCKDGNYKPIELTATNLINDKIINGVLLNYHDITTRKLDEEALAQMSSRLNLALRVGGIGVWDYDLVNNILFWDNQMFAIYGIREEDFSNAYDAWLKGLHPDDKIRGDEEIQMAIRGEKEFDTEFRVVWPDGSIHFVRALAAVERDNSGRALRLIGTNWDITHQKQAANFENEMLQLSTKLTGVTTSEIDSALNLALLRIGQFLNADRAYIFEINKQDETMNNTHEWCNEAILPEIENLQHVPCDMLPNWMETLEAYQNIVIPSVLDLPESWQGEREILEPQGIQSLVVIPLLVENNLIGFVGLDSVKTKRGYNSTEINILKVWSSMLASLIHNKRTEGLLEQTRQNYETFFNTIDDFLFIFEENGNIVDVNKTVTDRLGYQPEEIINQSVLFVRPVNRHAEALKVMKDILNNTISYCTIPLLTKSGVQIPVETRLKRGFWNGRPVIFGVSKDISQIKISEQKFASAFHSNSAVMTITRFDDDQFVDVNNAFFSLLGYSREEIRGKTLFTLGIVKEIGEGKKIQTFIEEGISVKEIEINAYSKSNESFIFLMSAEEIFVGLERCILSVAVNITERKIMENELRKARKEADQANMAKSEFLSRMSHELRTPMNSILGFAQLLDMGVLNPGQKKGVSHIMKSGRHLLDLINEVLDISKIEAGRLSLSIEPVQLKGIIGEMIDVVKMQADDRRIKINLISSSSLQLFVRTDKRRLKQVLLNLLNNAIKYNHEGGSVSIKTELQQADELGIVMIRISITDTGLGISEEDLPKLFKAFERIGAEKTETEGTGLGLAVVKRLMDAMEGNVGIVSAPGVGSTLWIELPVTENQKSVNEFNEWKAKHAVELTSANKELAFQKDEKAKRAAELIIANEELTFQKDEKAKRAAELIIANEELAFQKDEKAKRAAELIIANKELAFQKDEKAKRASELIIANKELAFQNEEKVKRAAELIIVNRTLLFRDIEREKLLAELTLANSEITFNNELSAKKDATVIEKPGIVLYIEDNWPNAELVKEIFSNNCPRIRLITSEYGNLAVQFACDYSPDLILLDLDLPDMHGSKVLKNLKADKRTKMIPVIIVSADAMPNQINQLIKAGAKDYLTKPLDINKFLKVLDEWIGKKEQDDKKH